MEYQDLLNCNWEDLKFSYKDNYLHIIHFLFLEKSSYYGENFYMNRLRKHMIRKKYLKTNCSYENTIKKFDQINNKDQIINQVDLDITTI